MKKRIELMSKLLREMEADIGTRDVANLVFESFVDSLKALDVKTTKGFCPQFKKFLEVICNTEPKFGILDYHFNNLKKEFDQVLCTKDLSTKKWKHLVIKRVDQVLKYSRKQKKNLLHHSEKINVEGKTILIHDQSHTVQDILVHYKKMGKHFNVVIAEQDYDKTQNNIEKMHASKIPFQVVPTYMISHVADTIDMLFFGALTLKDSMHFVMSPGTHALISEFHVENIPSYMFISTAKFSLWKSKKRKEIFIHKHKRKHAYKAIEYERVKYSHDRVNVDLFKKIVTNKGIFSSNKLEGLFKESLSKYEKAIEKRLI